MQYNTVINGDCDRIMPEMIEEGIKADLILTDPPYNLNKDFGNDSDKLELSDFLKVTKSRVNLCKQLLEPNGSLLWFGIHHYIGFIQTIMYEAGLYYRRMNIWYYENGFSRTSKAPLAQYFSRQSICKRKNSASCTETGGLDYGTDKGILPQKYRWKI